MTQTIENLTQAEIIAIIRRNLGALVDASDMGPEYICNIEEAEYYGKIFVHFDYQDDKEDREAGTICRLKGRGAAQIGRVIDVDASRIYGRRDFTDWDFEAEIQDEDTGMWVFFTAEQYQQEDEIEDDEVA